jgi:hypothetical protein
VGALGRTDEKAPADLPGDRPGSFLFIFQRGLFAWVCERGPAPAGQKLGIRDAWAGSTAHSAKHGTGKKEAGPEWRRLLVVSLREIQESSG